LSSRDDGGPAAQAAFVTGRLDVRAVGLALLVMAVLGASYTMVKLGLRDLPVFGSLMLRMALATIVLVAHARWRHLPLAFRGRAAAFVAGQTAAFVLNQALLYLGLTMTTAGRAAILFNVQPFFTLILLPRFVPSERLTVRRSTGTAIAFVGVVLVLIERGTAGGALLGDVLVLLGALAWSANTIMNKTMPRELPTVSVIAWNVAAAVPVMGLMTLLLESRASWHFTAAAIASVVFLGVVAAAAGFVLFVWLIRTYSAARVNVFVFLSPVFGLLIAWLVLAEPISLLQAVGAFTVAAGIWVVNSGA